MATIEKKFREGVKNLKQYVAIATVNAKKYQETNLAIVRDLTEKENNPGVYITLNKPYETMVEVMKRAKVDTRMIIFIDAVTRTSGGEAKKTRQCLFIGSPDNLSDISIAMDQAVRALPAVDRFVFFDSLSTLLIYNNITSVAKFIHFLAGKMRVWKVKGIIVSLRKDKDKDLIDELSQFCDVALEFS